MSGILFVDSRVTDLEWLLTGLAEDLRVVVLDPLSNGVGQIAAELEGLSELDSIHIVSHGSPGTLYLGSSELSTENLTQYQVDLAQIGASLADTGDLLLYGCAVGAGATGEQFVKGLAAYTGADVAASSDVTGSPLLGADWQLEVSRGVIETPSALAAEAQIGYAHTLGAPYLTPGPATLDASFGTDGRVTTAIGPGLDLALELELQPDGKVLLVGQSDDSLGRDQFAVVRYNADGTLDTSFGSGGVVTTLLGQSARAWDLVVQPDGKVVVAGAGGASGFALVRYDTDGTLDPAFGAGGIAVASFGVNSARGHGVAIQDDGKLLVAGAIRVTGATPDAFGLARYNTDGSLDTTFDGDGWTATPMGSGSGIATAVAVQPDGKILVGGHAGTGTELDFAIARYNSDGSLDASFNGDGRVILSQTGWNTPFAVALQADSKILISGDWALNPGNSVGLVRLNTDGSLDASFGQGGVATAGPGWPAAGQGRDIELQADGKILVAGYGSNLGSTDFAVVRFNSDGSVDPSFGSSALYGSGVFTADLSMLRDAANGVAIQSDGSIVIGGLSWADGFAAAQVKLGGLANQNAPANLPFSLQVPGDLFTDPEGGALVYAAARADGSPLPAWLDFDPVTRTLSGTPTNADLGSLKVRITATDGEGLSAEDVFAIAIGPTPIIGTSLADTLLGTDGQDSIFAALGNDSVAAGGGDDVVRGDVGDDTLRAQAGDDRLHGGLGADLLDGGEGNDTLLGGGDDDFLAGGLGRDLLESGWGFDTFWYNSAGAENADTILDFASPYDVIELDPSAFPSLASLAGNPLPANNFLAGFAPAASNGDQMVLFDVRTDSLYYDPDGSGPAAPELIATFSGSALLPSAQNIVIGHYSRILGTEADDTLTGTGAADSIVGFGGDDSISAGAGDDTVRGGDGNDIVDAGSGNDTLRGGQDSDLLAGRGGNDLLTGGAGNDTFFFDGTGIATADLVTDFMTGEDVLALDATVLVSLVGLVGGAPSPGNFVSGAAPAPQDTNQLLLYDTSTGDLYYDPDGSGVAPAELIARLSGAPALGATDIFVGPVSHISGSAGSDTLNGTDGHDSIVGLDGDDRIFAGDGNDTLLGGAGNDDLHGNPGSDTLIGGDGDDTLSAGRNDDFLDGGAGNDLLQGRRGNDVLVGGLGNDTFWFNEGGTTTEDTIADFSPGEDTIELDSSLLASLVGIAGGAPAAGNFLAAAGPVPQDTNQLLLYDTATGALYYDPDGSGAAAAERIATLAGAPALGATDIFVGPVARITGTAGSDTLDGTPGNDSLVGFDGNDRIWAGDGDDTVLAGDGDDAVRGGAGNDTILGGSGDDWLQGDFHAWWITTAVGGMDSLLGGDGNDTLSGGKNGDVLDGGAGEDLLQGRLGNDLLTGGADNDIFWFNTAGVATADTIVDFNPGQDRIELDPSSSLALAVALYGVDLGIDASLLASLAGMAGGSPAAGNFLAGVAPVAQNTNQLLLYDTSTGDFYYDPDGSGAAPAELIATLDGAPALSASDIFIS